MAHQQTVETMTNSDTQVIDFTPSGNSAEFVREGWSDPEPPGTWSVGLESRVVFSTGGSMQHCVVEFVVLDYKLAGSKPQRLSFVVDEKVVYAGEVAGWTVGSFEIPDELTASDSIEIRIIHPDAERPSTLGVSTDPRHLAVMFQRLTLKGERSQRGAVGAMPPDVAATDRKDVARTAPGDTSVPVAAKGPAPDKRPPTKSWFGFLGW